MNSLVWDNMPVPANHEERILLLPLLGLLRSRRWVRPGTTMVMEFAWNGRRVDLATLTASGRSSAFELKIGSYGRALEQAMYNRLSFDRSWVVVPTEPRPAGLAEAKEHGVGVIVVGSQTRVLLRASSQLVSTVVHQRLREKLRRDAR